MTRVQIATALATIVLPVAATAEPLRIVTDISPVESLVQMVAGDLADVNVIVRPGASPHGYAMRPSDAQAMQDADLVVWIGPGLTPWMADPIENVAGQADLMTLSDVPGIVTFETRVGATFAAHDHDHDEMHNHDDHAHDKDAHDDHGHDEHGHDDDGHEDHAREEHTHDDHGHDDHTEAAAHDDDHGHGDHADGGGTDPHLWLMPQNARTWLAALAETLSDLAPEHSETFSANAQVAIEAIETASADAQALLGAVDDRPFVAYHDAFQYFENSFGLSAAGALSLSDATPPSAARIREIRDLVRDEGIVCAFSEPQFDPGLVETVFGEDTEVSVAVLDPLAAEIPAGPELYPALIRALATSIADCLS